MSFTITRVLIRLIKTERDFSFIDKIGALTNALINVIPNTELQRNGQYGALIVINPVYNFEAQITKTETNTAINLEKNIDDEDFKSYIESILDVNQKISSTIKKITESTNDLKSIICQIEGFASEDKSERIHEYLSENCANRFMNDRSELSQISYVWREGMFEKYVNIAKAGTRYKYIYAIQDFEKRDMAFSNIRNVIDYSMRDFREKIITTIED